MPSEVFVTRYGEWFVVSVVTPHYDPFTGITVRNEHIYGSFRDQSDAFDLREALLRASTGDLKPEELTNGHLPDDE